MNFFRTLKISISLKQSSMIRILVALIPVLITSIYFFGWRVMVVLLVSCFFAFLTELVTVSIRNEKVTTACFVTGSLYALSLPPTIPFWIAIVGIIFAIFFGKEVFGGFGRNIFNPAIVGRAFVYICFPVELTAKFTPSFNIFPGGFLRWSFVSDLKISPDYLMYEGLQIVDIITSATPIMIMKYSGHIIDSSNLFFGNLNGLFYKDEIKGVLAAGSCGEISFFALTISVLYLLYTRTINYRLFFGVIIGATFSHYFFYFFVGFDIKIPLTFTLFSGGLFYAAIFMVTEPISAPKKKRSQWLYSIFIGFMIVMFKFKAIFAGGVAFSILLGNMLAPSLDIWFNKYSRK